ncbi:hypothetical protein Bpfe_023103, partial [Biomphalaria pfeifferi]
TTHILTAVRLFFGLTRSSRRSRFDGPSLLPCNFTSNPFSVIPSYHFDVGCNPLKLGMVHRLLAILIVFKPGGPRYFVLRPISQEN